MTARKVREWSRRRGVHRRVDADGTVWRISPTVYADVVLTMTYRDVRLTSGHPNVEAAKRHVDDMLRAFAARTLRDYPDAEQAIPNSDEQVCMEL